MAGKALIVAMSRRIAVALHDEIARLRPEWVTDDDATGTIKVVITGSAADDPTMVLESIDHLRRYLSLLFTTRNSQHTRKAPS